MDQGTQGLLSPFLRRARFNSVKNRLIGRVLDIGCGGGHLAKVVQPDFYVGVDRDAEVVEAASKAFPKHTFQTEFPDGEKFDTVVALAIVEHLPSPSKEITKWCSLLNPGGRIVLTTPHKAFRVVHDIGASIGVFSAEAADEHEEMFDRDGLQNLAVSAGMTMGEYQRFLFGANQLAIFSA